MPIKEKRKLSEEEFAAGVVINDQVLFAEFFFKDELSLALSKEQKLFIGDQSDRVLLCTGRKIAKTIRLETAICQSLFTNQRDDGGVDEALFFAPSEVHLNPVMDRVFSRVDKTPVFKAMVREKRKGESAFLESKLGMRWYWRIEGTSNTDKNVIGLRAKMIVGDEQAYGSREVYKSLLQTALPGCKWILAGVPNGVRQSPFWELDQTDKGKSWSRHKYPTFINPLYSDEAKRQQLMDDYGGESNRDYVTQVLGLWGEEMISSFPPGSIAYRNSPYFFKNVSVSTESDMTHLSVRVGIPGIRCNRFAGGWDYGFSPDPSVLTWSYCRDNEEEWQLYCRVVMNRVPMPYQVQVVRYIMTKVFTGQFIGLSCDKQEAIQSLQQLDPNNQHLYLWSNPGGSTQIEIAADRVEQIDKRTRRKTEGGMKLVSISNKELYIGWLKAWMINAVNNIAGRHLWLGDDKEVVGELIATTERKTQGGRTQYYGPSDPNSKKSILDHNRESLSYLTHAIEIGIKSVGTANNEADLLAALGWTGGDSNWKAPWDGVTAKNEWNG